MLGTYGQEEVIDRGVRGMGCFADLPHRLGCEERFHQKSQSTTFQTKQDRDPSKGLVSGGQWCLCVGKAQGTCFRTLLVCVERHIEPS